MKRLLFTVAMMLFAYGGFAQNGLEAGYRGFLDFAWNMDEGGNAST